MTERRISRRALFDVLRAPREETGKAPSDDGFSLDAFYGGRATGGSTDVQVIPRFEVRRGGLAATPSFAGVVRVREHACLAWQRSFCSVCVERCPVPDAILVTLGRPRVDPARCTGCGACVAACPAPINGFDMVTREPGAG